MKKLIYFLAVVCPFSCMQPNSSGGAGSEAARLNKLAMDSLYASSGLSFEQRLAKSIKLLDQAIKADSNYFTAYWNKFRFQNELGRFSDALSTGKQMMRLRPLDAHIQNEIGMVYEKTGDTLSAMHCFAGALAICDSDLKKLNNNSPRQRLAEENKAVALILLKQSQKGYAILKKLHDRETNVNYRQHLLILINMSRHDLIYGKMDTIGSF